MRFLSTILFALMALVLPMAGVQKYFCTSSMAFVEKAECLVKENDCCKKGHQPAKPDCFISAKLIPDADKAVPCQLPASEAVREAVPIPIAVIPSASVAAGAFPDKERGPPDWSTLFLVQERLLI